MAKRHYGPEDRDYVSLVEYTIKGTQMSLSDAPKLNGSGIMEHEAEDILSLRSYQNCQRSADGSSFCCPYCGQQW